MFIRTKKNGTRTYLQIVENQRVNGKVKQRLLYNLGRLEHLQESGKIDALIESGIKFTKQLHVLAAHKKGETETITHTLHIGPSLLFEKIWKELGIPDVINTQSENRRFQFSVERTIFMTVLHRLFISGSDRAADKWKRDYAINGCEKLELQHLYRSMGWLGREVSEDKQEHANPFIYRCQKDLIEEELYFRNRDLFSDVSMVFFDTTSLYFEGDGGLLLGHHGHSKDHRPDLYQMVVGVVIDNKGNPICSEIMPGNTADVKTLIPVANRLKHRFGVERVCVVADRGMISKDTIAELEELGWDYILGVRMRRVNEVKHHVMEHFGNFKVIHPHRKKAKDPSPLKVKEVTVNNTRYIICHNEEQAIKDRRTRESILEGLRTKLSSGDKSLVGNKGYRRYLKCEKNHFSIDEEKIEEEKIYDGKWVLITSTNMSAADTALKYKELLMVEDIFRTMKSILDTRPIYHKCDETITGHVFCSFLALKLRKYLQDKMESRGWKLEWKDIIRDVNELSQVEVIHGDKTFTIRTEVKGGAGKVFQAAGVALPPVLQTKEKCGTTPVPIL